MKIREVMTQPVEIINGNAPVIEAAIKMKELLGGSYAAR
jgi:CBS domain-containing protein